MILMPFFSLNQERKKKLIAAEEKVIEIARKNGEPTEEYEKILNKFKGEM